MGKKIQVKDLPVFDAADYLQDEQACAEYLSAVLEDDDPVLLAAALGDVARARGGMSQLARDSGLTREGLYKALSVEGNPSFATVMRVVRALGMRVSVQPLG